MQKFLQFFPLQISHEKICEMFIKISLDVKKYYTFFQIFKMIILAKNCEKPNSHNQRILIQYGGYRAKNVQEIILNEVPSNS